MEELQYGPNGGLIYCMEFLMNNLDWFEDEVGAYTDDYLIIDCPGQIELYTHFDIMKRLVEALGRLNIAICGVYLLESVSEQTHNKKFWNGREMDEKRWKGRTEITDLFILFFVVVVFVGVKSNSWKTSQNSLRE